MIMTDSAVGKPLQVDISAKFGTDQGLNIIIAFLAQPQKFAVQQIQNDSYFGENDITSKQKSQNIIFRTGTSRFNKSKMTAILVKMM